jgi:carbamoyl-phosphate synthase small subunit
MEGTRDGRTANLSKDPVDSAHPAGAEHKNDNKTEDKK